MRFYLKKTNPNVDRILVRFCSNKTNPNVDRIYQIKEDSSLKFSAYLM